MTITHIHKNSLRAWCGLDHAEVGTRIVRQTDPLQQCTLEAGISSEV